MGMMEEFYDPKNGTVLGRSAASWAKILVFYFIYYSFLGVLFWLFTIAFYQGQLPDVGNAPALQTRVDQPGISVHPFTGINRDFDGDQNEMVLHMGNPKEKNHEEALKKNDRFVKAEQDFIQTFRNNDKDSVWCKKGTQGDENTCKISQLNLFTDDGIKTAVETGHPMIFLQVNKIIHWKPHNSGKQPVGLSRSSFVEDSIYFDCFEYDLVNGKKVEDSSFDVSVGSVGLKSLGPEFYPYTGKDKVEGGKAYTKPFVAAKISPKAGKSWVDGQKYKFRCIALADNIQSPMVDTSQASDAEKDWSADQLKLSIGVQDFGIQYEIPEGYVPPKAKGARKFGGKGGKGGKGKGGKGKWGKGKGKGKGGKGKNKKQ